MSRTIRSASTRAEHILIVDDESFIREGIKLYFATEGYEVSAAANGKEALDFLAGQSIDLAILDIVMPGMNGVDLLRAMKKSYPETEVIMASGNGTLQIAVESMRLGAYDYITKPFLNFEEDLLKVVRKALERRRLLATNRELARDLQEANFELKSSNSKLRRQLAELELLSESGRLLSDVHDLPAFLALIDGTLRYHFEVEECLLLVAQADGWTALGARSAESDAPHAAVPRTQLSLLDRDGATVSCTAGDAERESLAQLFVAAGMGSAVGKRLRLLPLRACGEVRGVLVVPDLDMATQAEQLPALERFATLIAPPLALLLDRGPR